jgi:hypothetical protein
MPTSCDNGVKDGGETDVDCGGGCHQCTVFKTCAKAGDCLGGGCNGLSKQCGPSCTDLQKDQTETDVDCGGNCSLTGNKCQIGKKCAQANDCFSGFCADGVCCFSGCGGQCAACSVAASHQGTDGTCSAMASDLDECGGAFVCSGVGGFCESCSDKKKNGAETDVDCGGPCAGCGLGKHCKASSDCSAAFTCKGLAEPTLFCQ